MPRQPRLDAPGLLQHVMARGIEGREIFKDNQDRKSFLERLALIIEETQTQCYAWSLIPNHFHLLLRTGPTPLSKVMRRLMTGYAVTFNKRYKRTGHLFQNRYKSIVCEEDPYLLELIRYIHLNPLRAKLVQDLKELDKYPWTGHAAILGKRINPLIPKGPPNDAPSADRRIAISLLHQGTEKVKTNPEDPVDPVKNNKNSLAEATIEDVLLHFGDTIKVARRRYRQFVKNGIDQGKRPELQGGGLVRPACHARGENIWKQQNIGIVQGMLERQVEGKARAGRSAGGDKRGLLGRKKEERELGDERILGSGEFVENVLSGSDNIERPRPLRKIPLSELVKKIASLLKTECDEILSGNRRRKNCHARDLISFVASKSMGYKFHDIAGILDIYPVKCEAYLTGVHPVTAGRCAEKGKKLILCREICFCFYFTGMTNTREFGRYWSNADR